MAQVTGQVGPQALQDGVGTQPLRQGRTGEVNVSDTHGRYQEAVLRGNVFVASLQAGVALSTALNTTQTGFTLTNPAGSGKNLVILDATMSIASAPAGVSTIVWAANVNPVATAVTQTTPLTVRNALLGQSGTPAGLAASATTLPAAPVVVRAFGGVNATTSTTAHYLRDEVAGALALAPGTAISINCLTTAITVLVAVYWEECVI